jgi:uncharacterized membrane protein
MSDKLKITVILLAIILSIPFVIQASDLQKQRLEKIIVVEPKLLKDVDANDISIGWATAFELCANGYICDRKSQ